MEKKKKKMKRSCLREMHEWSPFSFFFLINSLVCFILFSVVWLCRCSVLFIFLRICIVLLRAAPAITVQDTLCSSHPKPGAILCQTVDKPFNSDPVMCQTLAGSFQAFRLHRKLCPSNLFLVLCSVGTGVSRRFGEPYNCPPPRTRGFVTLSLSFLALPTSQLLCFKLCRLPFLLCFHRLRPPAEQMDHLDRSASVTLWSACLCWLRSVWLWWGCPHFTAGGITLRQGQTNFTPRFTESKHFQRTWMGKGAPPPLPLHDRSALIL